MLNITRHLFYKKQYFLSKTIKNIALLTLAVPILLLSISLFFVLQNYLTNLYILFGIVIFLNAMLVMPFCISILEHSYTENFLKYTRLAENLHIANFKFFLLIDYPVIKSFLINAFLWSFSLALGDFTTVSIFGNWHFITLPWLLYQQIAHFQIQAANTTSIVLTFIILGVFLLGGVCDRTR